jgi:hypothetical protein
LLALLAGEQPQQVPKEQAKIEEKPIVPYDWSSIFASPEQEKKYVSPYAAAGGAVNDMIAANNELLKMLRG